ncbi:response regulator transcription factor [Pengzhenrongella frigida]|uniref:Response regulator transcription factor n=1 Tax=Pengzhenrongella frigida TaxID=1259133 RepID=A0A4V1ZH00_9MICO|nr:response regulator transcription factor [Cellulomonas sp. HLT2-17]RYV50314.1 response regulator transcription factor [Cellulomonas sp. HLT2-17]
MTTELQDTAGTTASASGPRVLLYSDDSDTRAQVLLAVGPRLSRGAPDIEWVQTATHAAVLTHADAGGFDLLVLDGEAAKSGGMGLCRQLKDELFQCPPILVLTGRPEDAWLASWSLADGVIARPFDPIELQSTVARLLAAPVTP